MTNPETSTNGLGQGLLEKLNNALPNCTAALRLCETGQQRPLTPLEKAGLRWHSKLCVFCQCARTKFEIAHEKYTEAEASRKNAVDPKT